MIFAALLLSLFLSQTPLETARSQFDAGNYESAVATLKDALDREPQAPSLHHWLGRSYYELHNYDAAIKHAETAVKLAPANAEYHQWLGRAYGAKAEQSRSFFFARKVKQAFEAAVRLAPDNIAARRDLMQYLAEAPWIVGGDKQKARRQIEVISAIDPLQGRLARAAYLAVEKQWELVEAEYLAVVEQRPSQMDAYMEAADFFAGRKDATNLHKAVEAAVRLDSHDPRLDFYRGVGLILRGTDFASAERLLTNYISTVPEKSDYPSHNSAMEWLRRIGH